VTSLTNRVGIRKLEWLPFYMVPKYNSTFFRFVTKHIIIIIITIQYYYNVVLKPTNEWSLWEWISLSSMYFTFVNLFSDLYVVCSYICFSVFFIFTVFLLVFMGHMLPKINLIWFDLNTSAQIQASLSQRRWEVLHSEQWEQIVYWETVWHWRLSDMYQFIKLSNHWSAISRFAQHCCNSGNKLQILPMQTHEQSRPIISSIETAGVGSEKMFLSLHWTKTFFHFFNTTIIWSVK